MNVMDCPSVEARLSAYLDQDLEAGERGIMDLHLAGCERCRRRRMELDEVVAWARSFPAFTPPAWLVPRVLARTRRIERETGWDTLRSVARWILEPRIATAVFTSVLVVGWILNEAGVRPALEDLVSPTAVLYRAENLAAEAYDGAVRFYYRAPLVTEIQSRLARIRESS